MTQTQRTPADLQAFIETNQLSAQLLRDVGATPTVAAAATVLGVEREQIMKTLLFCVDRPGAESKTPTHLIVISHGERRVDRRRLAAHFEVSHGRVRLATTDLVLDLLGYPAGGVPPFGHRTRLAYILDASLVAAASRYDGVFFAGGGDDRTMLKLTIEELIHVVEPEILAIS